MQAALAAETSPTVEVAESRAVQAQEPVHMLLHWEQDPKHLDPALVAKLRGCAEEIAKATLKARERLEPLLTVVR